MHGERLFHLTEPPITNLTLAFGSRKPPSEVSFKLLTEMFLFGFFLERNGRVDYCFSGGENGKVF